MDLDDWLKERKEWEKAGFLHDLSNVPVFFSYNSIEELKLDLEKTSAVGASFHIYRGQSDDWDIKSKLGRELSNVPNLERKRLIESNLILFFRNQAKERGILLPNENHLIIGIMQHYNAPTRFLDWSSNPLKSLFFAVQDERYYNVDGVLWTLNSRMLRHLFAYQPTEELNQFDNYEQGGSLEDNAKLFNKILENEIKLPLPFYVAERTPRIENQQGCFTCDGSLNFAVNDLTNRENWKIPLLEIAKISAGRWLFNWPLNESIHLAYPQELIRKITIPKNWKPELKNWLKKEKGISHDFLFPNSLNHDQTTLEEIGIETMNQLSQELTK